MIFIPVFWKLLLPCFVLFLFFLISLVRHVWFTHHKRPITCSSSFVSPSRHKARLLSLFFDRTISCIAWSWKEKKHYPPLRYSNALINSYVITLMVLNPHRQNTPYQPGLNSAVFTPRPRVPSSFFSLYTLFIVICFYALTLFLHKGGTVKISL